MKFLDRLGLTIFSTIVLIISMIICFVVSGLLETIIVVDVLRFLIIDNTIATNTTVVISILFILLALKCIFFNSSSREQARGRDGVLLENEHGKLLIAKDTIENLTNSVVKTFDSAESVMTKVDLDIENNITIYITLFVQPNAVIKDLTTKLQTDVIDTIKESLDLNVKQVNIRVKNIAQKKELTIKE